MTQETLQPSQRAAICPACNGAGGDNQHICHLCEGSGGVLPASILSEHDSRVKELEAALEPFAVEAAEYDYGDGSGPDLKGAPDASSLNDVNDLTVGDLRRARAALSSAPTAPVGEGGKS